MADFAPFEPEDMYLAAKFMDDSMAVFLEMRNALTQLGKKKLSYDFFNSGNVVAYNWNDWNRFVSFSFCRCRAERR